MGNLSGVVSALAPALTMSGVPGVIVSAGTQLINKSVARNEARATQQQALDQLQAQQALEETQAAQDAASEKAKIAAEAQATEDRRKLALRRAVARQKTLFSSQGLSGGDGSGEAVLLGLYNDSTLEADQNAQLDKLRVAALDQNVEQVKQKNLLEATQLADRQNLTRIINGY